MAKNKSGFRNHPRRDALIAIAAFSAFVLIFGAILFNHIKTMRQSYAALDWKSCPVVKVEKKAPATRKGNGAMRCHYIYDGKSYQTETRGWGELKSYRSLKKGQVYVNPTDPSESVISPGVCSEAWIILGILLPAVLALVAGLIWSVSYYVRNYAGKPRVVKKEHLADSEGPRRCKWDRYATLDELLDALKFPGNKDDVVTIENELNKAEGVQVISIEGNNYQLLVPEDAEWVDCLASPSMSKKEVLLWMEAYQLGVPVASLTEGWEEL